MLLQIDQLKREGKINQSEIKKLRDRLAYLPHKTLDEYKSQVDLLIVENVRLTRALESADNQIQEVTAIANESSKSAREYLLRRDLIST